MRAETDRQKIEKFMTVLSERNRAIPALERLLKLPGYLTPAFLRLDPDFDPLRGDPRFEKLCREK